MDYWNGGFVLSVNISSLFVIFKKHVGLNSIGIPTLLDFFIYPKKNLISAILGYFCRKRPPWFWWCCHIHPFIQMKLPVSNSYYFYLEIESSNVCSWAVLTESHQPDRTSAGYSNHQGNLVYSIHVFVIDWLFTGLTSKYYLTFVGTDQIYVITYKVPMMLWSKTKYVP